METPLAPPVLAMPAPTVQPDLRPTADAAAIARDPTPHVPLPAPASVVQTAKVTETRLADLGGHFGFDTNTKVERVLKPYGVHMLPHGETRSVAEAAAALEKESSKAPEVAMTGAAETHHDTA